MHPVTKSVCKQMLPVYDKPMIYYPLSALLLAGIKEILIISTPQDTPRFRHLLGTGSQLGVSFSYAAQKKPKGIAESFLIGEKFIGKDSVCLILGDNIFYGDNLLGLLQDAAGIDSGAVVFGYYVKNPQRYGVIAFDRRHKVVSIEEKPAKPKSNYAVCGIYFYDNEVLKIVKKIRPSPRGELEITDVNNAYLKKGKLNVKLLSRGYAWLDAGTPDTLIDASIFIKTVEDRQGLKIGCIEEVAYKMGLIKKDNLKKIASGMVSGYGAYLSKVCADE